jgi:hypothetical protein
VNIHCKGGIRLLVLIPHRDTRKPLRAWSGKLFAAGLAGAWSFPWAAPLACLSRFLSAGELRNAACALRELSGGGDGKFWARSPAASPFPAFFVPPQAGGPPAVYGLRLEPGGFEHILPGGAASKVIRWFSPPVLGAALTDAAGPETGAAPDVLSSSPPPDPPVLSFRAAALANMIFSPLEGGDRACSFEWRVGPLRWLPSVKKKKDAV